jgi:hypothetical protein
VEIGQKNLEASRSLALGKEAFVWLNVSAGAHCAPSTLICE